MHDPHDHRAIGQRLGLFHFQEEAPGMAFWHPRGLALLRALEDLVRRRMVREGFQEVRTPQILDRSVWERSGHWEHFREGLFAFEDRAVKPVNCPGHIQVLKRLAPSAGDLPLKLGEFGLCHRKEPSGALHGLFRLCQFTQDDGHLFCREDQVEGEVALFARSLADFYGAMGFSGVQVALATRPEPRAGSDALWDRAEAALDAAARAAGLSFQVHPGEGAFYGPKLEFTLTDRLGRAWQCGTIQLDFVLPERFELSYPDRDGVRKPLVMLHRAMLGSLERFLGILLEHCRGQLPPWLAPHAFLLAPVEEAQETAARELLRKLEAAGVRGLLDAGSDSLSRKVKKAHRLGIPWFLALGSREAEAGTFAIRERDGRSRVMAIEEGVAWMAGAVTGP